MTRFEPVAAPLGAVAHDVDPTATLDPAVVAAFEDALRTFAVITIRGYALTSDMLTDFARSFGEPDGHPISSTNVDDEGRIVALDSPEAAAVRLRQQWVTEGSFRAEPFRLSIAYATAVPSRGGQTQFADMRKAWGLVPPDDRTEMRSLHLVHTNGDERAEHPWVRTLADGTPSLYMGRHATHIAGRDVGSSRRWFDEIEAQLAVHDVFYEHQWQPHDIVIWHNHMTLQRTLGFDMANEARTVLYINIVG